MLISYREWEKGMKSLIKAQKKDILYRKKMDMEYEKREKLLEMNKETLDISKELKDEALFLYEDYDYMFDLVGKHVVEKVKKRKGYA